MTNKKLERANNLKEYIEFLKKNLECIRDYEKNKDTCPFEISLWQNHDTGVIHKIKLEYYPTTKTKLKNDIINMIKIDLINDIQKAEKEFKEL